MRHLPGFAIIFILAFASTSFAARRGGGGSSNSGGSSSSSAGAAPSKNINPSDVVAGGQLILGGDSKTGGSSGNNPSSASGFPPSPGIAPAPRLPRPSPPPSPPDTPLPPNVPDDPPPHPPRPPRPLPPSPSPPPPPPSPRPPPPQPPPPEQLPACIRLHYTGDNFFSDNTLGCSGGVPGSIFSRLREAVAMFVMDRVTSYNIYQNWGLRVCNTRLIGMCTSVQAQNMGLTLKAAGSVLPMVFKRVFPNITSCIGRESYHWRATVGENVLDLGQPLSTTASCDCTNFSPPKSSPPSPPPPPPLSPSCERGVGMVTPPMRFKPNVLYESNFTVVRGLNPGRLPCFALEATSNVTSVVGANGCIMTRLTGILLRANNTLHGALKHVVFRTWEGDRIYELNAAFWNRHLTAAGIWSNTLALTALILGPGNFPPYWSADVVRRLEPYGQAKVCLHFEDNSPSMLREFCMGSSCTVHMYYTPQCCPANIVAMPVPGNMFIIGSGAVNGTGTGSSTANYTGNNAVNITGVNINSTSVTAGNSSTGKSIGNTTGGSTSGSRVSNSTSGGASPVPQQQAMAAQPPPSGAAGGNQVALGGSSSSAL